MLPQCDEQLSLPGGPDRNLPKCILDLSIGPLLLLKSWYAAAVRKLPELQNARVVSSMETL